MITLGLSGAGAPVEHRQGSYTDAVIAALLARAAGRTLDSPEAIGAQEAAAGIWSRAFAIGRPKGDGARLASITPDVLGCIGRELCRRGEALFLIDVDPATGRIELLPVGHWNVRGGVSRATWWYRVDLYGPDVTATRTVPEAGVVHVRYATDPARPWDGLSPLQVAAQTGRLAAAVESALGDEAAGPRGQIVTAPEATGAEGEGDDPTDPYAELKVDLRKLAGGLAVVESFAAGGGDQGARPDRDWRPERLGAKPPEALVELRQQVSNAVLAACGVSPSLFASGGGAAAAVREAFRLFYRSTVLPVAALVESELSRKLETAVELDLSALGAADVATAARAYHSLVDAQMPPADARRLAGLA